MGQKLPKNFVVRMSTLIEEGELAIAEEELTIHLALNQDDPQLQILMGKLAYAKGDMARAEAIFREVMKTAVQAQILAEARKGLALIEQDEVQRRQQRSAEVAATAEGKAMGFLALLPVDRADISLRSELVHRLARILRTDVYTARFKLPTRYLKILRVGTIADLQAYGEELQGAGIPCVWISLNQIANIQVQQVQYFQPLGLGEVRAVCAEGERVFGWTQVTARVEGLLPTYGKVVDVGKKNQIITREEILDRIRICDFHVPSENLILRFHDSAYRFDQGMQVEVQRPLPHIAPTVCERWQGMMNWFSSTQPQIPVQSHFSQFTDMALLYPDLLKKIEPRVNIQRPKPQLIDNCFELFSATVFLTHHG